MPKLKKSILAASLLVAGLSACMPEEGMPQSSIPISAEFLPYLEASGYAQKMAEGKTVVSKGGVDLWRYANDCRLFCLAASYIGPTGLEAEITEQFRVSYLAAKETMHAEQRAILGLPNPRDAVDPGLMPLAFN